MAGVLVPAAGAGALQIGTPPILALAPLAGALDLHERAGMTALREKSLRLTAYLRALVETRLTRFGVSVATPREDARRGGHLALVHPDASRVCRALRAAGVIPDFRPPDIIRLAPVPLYTRFADCWEAVCRLETILAEKRHERLDAGRETVS
jgi:kynureninase